MCLPRAFVGARRRRSAGQWRQTLTDPLAPRRERWRRKVAVAERFRGRDPREWIVPEQILEELEGVWSRLDPCEPMRQLVVRLLRELHLGGEWQRREGGPDLL